MKKISIFIIIFILMYGFIYAGDHQGKYVIKNATIVTVTGPIIEKGAVIIDGNKITYVGRFPSIPEGAEVIDAEGLYVYPGMINSYTTLGLTEIGSVRETNDAREVGDFNTFIKASSAINPSSVHIPITRVNGITTALTVPQGSLICGYGALINLYGWTIEEMILEDKAVMVVNFPRSTPFAYFREPTKEEKKKAAEKAKKQIEKMENLFEKARLYYKAKKSYEAGELKTPPPVDMTLDALIPVIKGEVPLLIGVSNEKDIKEAVKVVNNVKVKAIFTGVNDGWKVADLLAKNKIPCLVGSVLSVPGNKDPFDAGYANAGILNKAGVKIAFVTGGASDARNLPYHAGMSAAYGLPRDEALKAVTIYPAQIFGVDDKIGSIEVGKIANIVVTDDDILEMRTHIKYLFINGKNVPLKSKHTELYEKYKKKYGIK
ncbi:amidohydrolase [candidate division KSB1 bacterium]|nr:MAG: amidohydrolase [candidate division KSB1 bacterium]